VKRIGKKSDEAIPGNPEPCASASKESTNLENRQGRNLSTGGFRTSMERKQNCNHSTPHRQGS